MTTEVTAGLDVAAYFGRTGYAGATEPTVETLQALVAAHNGTIPFENLDPSPAARGPRRASPSPISAAASSPTSSCTGTAAATATSRTA
jgi:hypothetical protein